MSTYGPDPKALFPNPAAPNVCFIKNAVTRPNIEVGAGAVVKPGAMLYDSVSAGEGGER